MSVYKNCQVCGQDALLQDVKGKGPFQRVWVCPDGHKEVKSATGPSQSRGQSGDEKPSPEHQLRDLQRLNGLLDDLEGIEDEGPE